MNNSLESEEKLRRVYSNYILFRDWIMVYSLGRNISTYLLNKEYKKIAIYGFGEVGQILFQQLKKENKIDVEYAVDVNFKYIYSELPIFSPEDMLKDVDAIVVTPVFDFECIKNKLELKSNMPILSLHDIILEA